MESMNVFDLFHFIISLHRHLGPHTDLLSPVFALLMCTSITITKCDFPEPTVEFYKNATGFKTSLSGLSVALTGAWSTHFGLM